MLLLLLLLASLPFFVLYRVADLLYLLLTYVVRYRRAVILDNLRQSFPELTEKALWHLAKAFYRNISDVIVETVKLPGLSPHDLRRRMTYTNPEVALKWLAAGQTVVGVAPHATSKAAPLPPTVRRRKSRRDNRRFEPSRFIALLLRIAYWR